MQRLISRHTFKANEIEIFRAVQKWAKSKGDEKARPLLDQLPVQTMSVYYLVGPLRASGMFTDTAIVDAIALRKMRVYVRLPDGERRSLKIRASVTVKELLETIDCGEDVWSMRMSYKGRYLPYC